MKRRTSASTEHHSVRHSGLRTPTARLQGPVMRDVGRNLRRGMTRDDNLSRPIERTLKDAVTGSPYARDGVYAQSLQKLPAGLRALASTYYLDVSLALDSIDWHFLNFSGHAKETLEGLRFLGLEEMVVLFERTHELVLPHLSYLTKDNMDDVYARHRITDEIDSLCERSWE